MASQVTLDLLVEIERELIRSGENVRWQPELADRLEALARKVGVEVERLKAAGKSA